MKPTVIMRSQNDMPLVAETLSRLSEQECEFELMVLDNASSDGTAEEVKKYTDKVVNIPSGEYIPGKVLNLGMELSTGEFTAFINSDCTPQNSKWLSELLAGFKDEQVAAVFGRQVPRPDCKILFAKDTEDTYGDGSRQKYWRHCFSMASSAIRRSVWEKMKFDERLQYSEDIDWTWRARQQGYSIGYVPESIVMHSHNYSLRVFHKRHYGEGKAEAIIFDWPSWQKSLLRYSLLPCARQVLSDWKYCLPRFALGGVLYSPMLRMAQAFGRRTGFKAGLRKIKGQK